MQRVLQIDEPLLHDEAEKLEHVMSDQLIMKIDAFLEYPNIDPHGSVIPFSIGKEIKYLLSELEPNISFKVFRIPMMGNEETFCSDNGFLPVNLGWIFRRPTVWILFIYPIVRQSS